MQVDRSLGWATVETVSDCGMVERAWKNRYLALNPDVINY